MLPITIPLVLILGGCRPPSLPQQPSRSEYAVYNAWLEQFSATLPPQLPLVVDAHTLLLRQHEFQFQECLPSRMRGLLDGATPVALSSSSGNEWLSLSDRRPVALHDAALSPAPGNAAEWIWLSRVAFTLSGYDAYLWVQHQTCGARSGSCDVGYGILVHGKKSSGTWTFEDTSCQALIPPGAS